MHQPVHRGLAPAAIVLGAVDVIIRLGILVRIEIGLPAVPLLVLPPLAQAAFRQGATVTIDAEGRVAEVTRA